MQITVRFISLALASVINLMLGSFLLWRYRAVRLTRVFALEVLAVAGFSFFTAGLAAITSEASAVAWVRAFEVFAHLTTLAFFYFAAVFSRSESRLSKAAFWGAAFVFALEGGARALGLAPVALEFRGDQGWFPVNDRLYNLLYTPVMLSMLLGGIALIVRARIRAQSPVLKKQLSLFLLAMAAAVLLSNANQVKGIESLALFAPVAYTAIIAYAITRHRLFETSLLLKKGAVAAGGASVVALAYVLSLLLGQEIWTGGIQQSLFAAFVTALAMAAAYGPLQGALRRIFNRWLGLAELNSSQRLLEYSLLFSAHAGLGGYLEALAGKICADFGLEDASFWMRDRVGRVERIAAHPAALLEAPAAVDPQDPSLDGIRSLPEGADADELAWTSGYQQGGLSGLSAHAEPLRGFLVSNKAQAAFPILEGSSLLGILVLGPRASGRALGRDEFAFFSALCAQLSTSIQNSRLHNQVQQADRLSTLGTLSASMAHELRNPLTSISTMVQMMPDRHGDEKFREKFSRIVGSEIEKLTRLTEQLLSFSRPSLGSRSAQDLLPVCERVRQLLKHQFSRKNVALVIEGEPGCCWASVNEAEISQVLINLLLNALQATGGGGRVTLSLQGEGGRALLRVTDTGSGMTAEQLGQAFSPFYTTKNDGTGLGLSTCLRIVEQHGGSLSAVSEEGKGSSFTISLKSAVNAGEARGMAA